jgi:hypothetical protein
VLKLPKKPAYVKDSFQLLAVSGQLDEAKQGFLNYPSKSMVIAPI